MQSWHTFTNTYYLFTSPIISVNCFKMVWIPDGSSGFVINANIVTHIDKSECDNVFNCLWEECDGVSTGKHYWKIHFRTLKGGGGVGLTSKDYFKQGYGCEGVCYNGNLSDGRRLFVSDFGPSPVTGDTLGILASFEGNRLKVYFDINGKSLGLAFCVKALKFATVFPMVRFKHSGSATCQKQTEIPNIQKRHCTIYSGIEGDWKLKYINRIDLPAMLTRVVLSPKMNLKNIGEDKFNWYMEVLNSFKTTLSKCDSKWETDGITRTLIKSNELVMEQEKQISHLMDCVDTVNLEHDGSLLIKSGTLSTVWRRYDATPRPYVSDFKCEMM